MVSIKNKFQNKLPKTLFSRHFLSFFIIILLIFIIGFYNWINFPSFLGNNKEVTSKLSLVMKKIFPTMYEYDFELNFIYDNYSVPILWIWAILLRFFGEFKLVFTLLYFVLSFVFLVGIYKLTHCMTGSPFASILMVFLTIPVRRALGEETLWGLSIFSSTPFAEAFSLAFAPWLIYIFMRSYKNRLGLSILFFIDAFLLFFHPISSIHLFFLFSLSIVVLEKQASTWFKRLYLPCIFFLAGSIPFLMLNYEIIKSNFFPPDVSVFDFFYRPILSNEFLFDILPILFIALFVCIENQTENISEVEKLALIFLILAALISSMAFLTPYLPLINILQLQQMSKFFFLIPLIFISGYLGCMLKSRKGYHKFLPAIVLFILLFPSIYIQPLRQYTETTIQGQIPNPGSKEDAIQPQDVESFLELCNFCRINTHKEALFLAPLDGYSSFRIYSKRGLLISDLINSQTLLSTHFSKRWFRTYNDIKNIKDNSGGALLRKFIKAYNVDYMIIKKRSNSTDYEKGGGIMMVFSNDRFILLAFDKSIK